MMVTGSAAQGQADFYSDLDMTAYYDVLPSEEDLRRAREQNGGVERLWLLGDRAEGAFAEAYMVGGVECQFAHAIVEAWERDMDAVLVQHETGSPVQKALSGLLIGVPLYGESLIRQWQARAAEYPPDLARAMVQAHLGFWPGWIMWHMVAERGERLWLAEMFAEAERNILGVLLGLNRVYHWGEYKRLESFVQKLPVAPLRLGARLDYIWCAEPGDAVAELCRLIRETLDLVELQMPDIEIGPLRTRLDRTREPWSPEGRASRGSTAPGAG